MILQIPLELVDHRIDVLLAKSFPAYSRGQLTTWLKAGLITLNGQMAKPKDKVKLTDSIEYPEHWPTTMLFNQTDLAESIPLSVVYEDNDLMIINKPAGLVVHPGAGNQTHTLVNALLHHAPDLKDLPRAGIVHRLDKETTGLLIIGKTLTAYTDLVRQMQAREIKRQYLALVQGTIISGGTIETAYGRHPHNRLKMTVSVGGRQAITHYRVNRTYEEYFTLIDVNLETGRTHQIRVHMAHINHPVLGDPLYGKRPKLPTDFPSDAQATLLGLHRQALHAAMLSFTHPVTQTTLTFQAPLPDDFQSVLNYLDEYFGSASC